MKRTMFSILMMAVLSGCGMQTGSGSFNGRIVDVSWEGMLFASCEVQFQRGEQSSSVSSGSTRDKSLCDELGKHIGKVVTIQYRTLFLPPPTIDTKYELYGDVVVK